LLTKLLLLQYFEHIGFLSRANTTASTSKDNNTVQLSDNDEEIVPSRRKFKKVDLTAKALAANKKKKPMNKKK